MFVDQCPISYFRFSVRQLVDSFSSLGCCGLSISCPAFGAPYMCVRAQSARNAREKMKVGIAVRFKLTATLKSKYFPMFGMNGKLQEIWILQVMSRAFSGPLPVESRILSCRRRPVHLSNFLTPTKGWNANHENLWVHSGVLKSKAPRISTFYYYICGTPRVALPWIASPSLWPPGWFHTGFALPKMQREYVFIMLLHIVTRTTGTNEGRV